MTDVWRVLMFGYRSTQKRYDIYDHVVIVHAMLMLFKDKLTLKVLKVLEVNQA